MGGGQDTGTIIATAAAAAALTYLTAGTSAALAGGGWAAFTSTSVLVKTAVTFVLVAAAASLKKSPGQSTFESMSQGRTSMVNQPLVNRRILYGKVRVSGPMVFAESTGSDHKFLHLVVCLASHRCDSIPEVWFNDKKLSLDGNGNATGDFNGHARVKKHLGSSSQTADSDLVSETNQWTNSHRLRSICYVYVRIKHNPDKYPNGIPNVSAVVKGKDDVFDPRDTTEKYTTNPALCLRDYVLFDRLGLGADEQEINEESVKTAANECEENVVNDDNSTENRYTMNGTIKTNNSHKKNIEEMLTAMAGNFVHSSGNFHINAGAFRSCDVSFDESDVVGSVSIKTEIPFAESFNSIRGTYVSPDNKWQPADFPAIKNDTYVSEDGEVRWQDIELPFTTSPTMARRISRIELRRARKPNTVEASFKLSALETKVGDSIKFSFDKMGWTEKRFEVQEWGFNVAGQEGGGGTSSPQIVIDMKLRETGSDVYENTEEIGQDSAPTLSVRDPFIVAAPTNLSVASDPVVQEDGSLRPRFDVTWDAPDDAFVTDGGIIEIQAKKSSSNSFTHLKFVDGAATQSFIEEDIIPGTDYDVRIRSHNTSGVRSSWVTDTNNTATGNTTTTSNVSGLTVTQHIEHIEAEWNQVTDADFSGYEIRVDNDGSFDANTAITITPNHDSTRFIISLGELRRLGASGKMTFGVRAVDNTGNTSGSWDTNTITVDDAPIDNAMNTKMIQSEVL